MKETKQQATENKTKRGGGTLTRVAIRLLYDMHSPRSNDGRGTAFGRIYNQRGQLVATTSQEGVMRLSRKEQALRREKMEQTVDQLDQVKTSTSKL